MKELQKNIKELLQKIIVKAYEVNENTKHTVFVRFSGQVNWLEVKIFLNGWKEDANEDISYTISLRRDNIVEQLKEALEKLEELEG